MTGVQIGSNRSEESRQERGIKLIGDYLLRGWVLTDDRCRNHASGCAMPTMRSRDGSKYVCVLCDDEKWPPASMVGPNGVDLVDGQSAAVGSISTLPTVSSLGRNDENSSLGDMEEPGMNGTMTVDDTDDDFNLPNGHDAPPLLNMADENRYELTNRATRLLGQRLLQGWTMLNEECPNPNCPGIPLCQNRQHHKYCVLCERTYVNEADLPLATASRQIPNSQGNIAQAAEASSNLHNIISEAGQPPSLMFSAEPTAAPALLSSATDASSVVHPTHSSSHATVASSSSSIASSSFILRADHIMPTFEATRATRPRHRSSIMTVDASQFNNDDGNSVKGPAAPGPPSPTSPSSDTRHLLPPASEEHHRRHLRRVEPTERQALLSNSCSRTSNESNIPINEDGQDHTDIEDGRFWWHLGCEFRWLVRIASPIVAAAVLNLSLGIVGTFMLGHLGTKELAAGALSLLFCNVTGISVGAGMASGLDSLCPQAFTGSADPYAVGKHLQRGLVIMFILTVPICILWSFTTPILKALGQDPELCTMAGNFAFVMMPSLFPYFANECIRRYILAQGLSRSQVFVYGISSPLNVFFQWFFVYGIKLGFIGSPIALSVSYTLLPILSIVYLRYIEGSACWGGWEWKEALDGRLLRQQIGYGAGGLMQMISEWWCFEIVALIAGLFGEISLATQSICMVTSALLFMIPMGLGSGVLIRVGNCLGSGNQPRRARLYGMFGPTYGTLIRRWQN
ncbi:hypothetical protein SeLEV6574_g04023 [Synchytrium endobioticum]|uniref:MATE efflux family protein n=1 Tax=Synchytrium endobioticum TaxID=286115 RepID=A0A507D168_9FUNG|nr:hypothetical protein SeLEV6574_g04023 [Synchytrium endobioticum]